MFEQSLSLIPVFGISLLSLFITFFLFKVLESYANAEGKALGSTVKYGGALAGFVVVTSSLVVLHNTLLPTPKPETNYDINGQWDIEFLHRSHASGDPILGAVSIHQQVGSKQISIVGETYSTVAGNRPAFKSITGTINDGNVIYVYDTTREELGLARGTLLEPTPEEFTVTFIDVVDKNGDPEGTIKFTRKANNED